MASFWFNNIKGELMGANHDLSASNAWDVVLMTSAIALSSDDEIKDTDNWSDLSAHEVADGNGYSTDGQTLSGLSITVDKTNNLAYLDGDDNTWPSSTIDARAAIVKKKSTGENAFYFDFGSLKSSNNGALTLQWSANGVARLT